jgi:translation initiation factor IF-3
LLKSTKTFSSKNRGWQISSRNRRFIRRNERIRSPQIRLIGSDGKQIGIVVPQQALTMARDEGLDLVEISPTAKPPVCRILDFGKYLYTLEKEEKHARKKQHIVHLKEIKLTSKIDDHDYQTKLRHATRFLERGDMVKLTLFFRGREMHHTDLGQKVMNRFIEDVSDIAIVEQNKGLEGRVMVVHLQPNTNNAKKKPKSAEKDAKTKDEKSSS